MEHLAKKLINWASILEPGAREQAQRTASMPFIWPHLALMPDAHQGKGSTVGSVVPTLGAIMPACVGVDIGCGMIAVRSDLVHDDLRGKPLAQLREAIENAIPLSAGRYNDKIHDDGTTSGSPNSRSVTARTAPRRSRRTGGCSSARSDRGNHFIEVSLDEEDRVWLFLHSGSRGVGNKLAIKHIKVARAWCERAWIQLPDPDLAYLVEGGDEFWAYMRDLRWAQHFALLNREEMMARVAECLAEFMGRDIPAVETIQCHHNYTEQMSGDLVRRWKRRQTGPGTSGCHARARSTPARASRADPGLDGHASYVVTARGTCCR